VVYTIQPDGSVVLSKAAPVEEKPEDPFHSFAEWDSEADRQAFAGL
jgi:hypothetical protein